MDPITKHYKIGEAARQVGLSVRALHHYESRGLLRPRRNESSDHRVYDREDLRRLKQIRLLRSYGLDLVTIQSCLEGASLSPVHQLRAKLSALRDHIAETKRQADGLECLLITLDAHASTPSEALPIEPKNSESHRNDNLKLNNESNFEPHPKPHSEPDAFKLAMDLMSAATDSLKQHHIDSMAEITRELGSEGIARQRQRWQAIVEQLRCAMIEGRSTNDPQVIDLARQWHCAIDDAYQGNSELRFDFCTMIRSDPDLCQRWMEGIHIDRELVHYLGRVSDYIQFDDQGRPQS